MRVVFMGSPETAVYPLYFLVLGGHQIAAVYTHPDKPAGRGRVPIAPPVKKSALAWNLPVIQGTSLKNSEAIEQLARLRPDIIVVAAFGQILPQAVLDIPCYGCINIHPSLLPKYRGASPVTAAILAGDEYAGVSIMRLNAGLDSGPVFKRAQIPILPQDTSGSLTSKLFQIGARMLLDVLAELPAGGLLPVPQIDAEASYTREITKKDGEIRWKLAAIDIWRQVRAYQPWPAAYTYWKGKLLKIIEAIPCIAAIPFEAGRVVTLPTAHKRIQATFGVGTGNGTLGILRVQIEGKRAMSASEFIQGQRGFIGSMLG